MRGERSLQLGQLVLELLEDREVLLALEGVAAVVGGIRDLGAVVTLGTEVVAQALHETLHARLLRLDPLASRFVLHGGQATCAAVARAGRAQPSARRICNISTSSSSMVSSRSKRSHGSSISISRCASSGPMGAIAAAS